MNPDSPAVPSRSRERIVRWLARWGGTPLHPTWLGRGVKQAPARLLRQVRGRVLDVGAGDGSWRAFLSPEVRYLSLDYYQTAHDWYGARPHVYGHAERLPFAPDHFDWVLLINVLEHLPHPEQSISEIRRVLKPGGCLLLQAPFLYPLHDVPLDFRRFTPYGLAVLSEEHGFRVLSQEALGHPVATAGLLLNIALSRGFLDLLVRRHPWFLLAPLLPFVVVAVNLLAWLAARILPAHEMVAQGWLAVWQKPLSPEETAESSP